MLSTFLNLVPEKQERILDAAMKEFADKGYKNASTNEIVQEANISKGLLFHYFKNKKGLFLFLYDYCIDLLINEFINKIDYNEKDFILRLRQASLQKLQLLKKYPKVIKFVEVAYMEESSIVKNDLELRKAKVMKLSYNKIFEDIDESLFKENVDIKKAMNIISWTLEGFGTSELQKLKSQNLDQIDYEKMFAEGDIYINMIKDCFYR